MSLRREGALDKKSDNEMVMQIKQKLAEGALNNHGNYSYTCAQLDNSIPQKDIFYGFYETLFLSDEINRLSEFTNIPQSAFDSNKKINKAIKPFIHTFSHYQLQVYPQVMRLTGRAKQLQQSQPSLWCDPGSPAEVGLAAPVKRLISRLAKS